MTRDVLTGMATHVGGRGTGRAALISPELFAVADGMGGLRDGEVASRLALDTLDAACAADHSVSGFLNAAEKPTTQYGGRRPWAAEMQRWAPR